MSAGTLFRGGVYNLVPNNNPIALPNGEWTIGIKLHAPFIGNNPGFPNIPEWSTLLSVGWISGSAILNEIKWYLNTALGVLSTNVSVRDTTGAGNSGIGLSIPVNHPIPKGNFWLFLRRAADGTWGEAYVEEGDTFTNFFTANANAQLAAGIGGMTGSGGTAPTEWYIGNIPDFAHNLARTYWLNETVQEFFIATRRMSDAEIQALATTSVATTVAVANGGQANLLRHYLFNGAPDTLIDLSNNAKDGVWEAPDYGASIAPWYPTVSKLAIGDQVVTDPTYTNGYDRSFAAVSNTSNFTDAGLTVVTGAFQVRSNILIANAINTRSKVRLSTIPQDTVYLRAEYLNVWNNDGDPTYVGIGLCTADGTSGYELESTSGGFALREVKAGVATLTSTFTNQGDDLNRTYAIELDDGYINFYTKASGASVYVLRGRMVNTVSGQLYPTYISETATGGLGKGASALTFKTALAVGGGQAVVAPSFASNFSVNVAENSTTVGTFAATSTGGEAPVYSLTGADAALFNINASTAAVTFKVAPDFETPSDAGTNNVYNFNVVATNSGGSNFATATVTVTDVVEVVTTPGIIFTLLRDISTIGRPLVASGTNVEMTVFAAGSPPVVQSYNAQVAGNGSVQFTDNSWVAGQTKECVLKVGSIKQTLTFTVIDL